MKIQWNKVTWYSILSAVVIFIGVYFLGFYVGTIYQSQHDFSLRGGIMMRGQNMMYWNTKNQQATSSASSTDSDIIASVSYLCGNNKTIHAVYMTEGVSLKLSDGRAIALPHVISADGARYANSDESFVFWNKGQGAFITEKGMDTYQNCNQVPSEDLIKG